MTAKPQKNATSLLLLGLGAATGLVLAAADLVSKGAFQTRALPPAAIAKVGDHLIPRSRYAELLSDLEADKKTPLSAEDREFVLDRLIDEELLILRGIELGLPESSPGVRKSLAASVIAHIAAESKSRAPDEASLRQFYESNKEFFSSTDRYQLRWWILPGDLDGSAEQADAIFQALNNGIPADQLIDSFELQEQTHLPRQLMPLTKLADYLGSDLVLQLQQIQVGNYSGLLAAGNNYHMLMLEDRQAGGPPPFEQARLMIEAEYLKRSDDQSLRDYLEWLRARADVTVAEQSAR